MNLYLLLIDKTQISIIWDVLNLYPIDNIIVVKINDNCVELKSNLNQTDLEENLKCYFYQIGYYGTFTILDPLLNDYEVVKY